MEIDPHIREVKVVLLGCQAVGKTSLVNQFIHDRFTVNTVSTIGCMFVTKTVKVDDMTVSLQIWDTGGSEKYRSMAPMYFRDAQAAIIVYDVTSISSFRGVDGWLRDLHNQGPAGILIALAGNKADCDHIREVTPQMAADFATKTNISICLETSALDGRGVAELFQLVVEKIAAGGINIQPRLPLVTRDSDESCC
jgi:Ras-related protein Rab-5C